MHVPAPITRTLTTLTAASALAFAAIGCSSDGDGDESSTDPGVTIVDTTTTEAETTTEPDPAGDDAPEPEEGTAAGDGTVSAADGELTDGRWAVGDAGFVEFAVSDGALSLIDASPNDGWEVTIDEDAPDEIEVDFRRGNQEYEMEIQLEGGILEIEIDLDIDPAEPGTFEIGPAATAELAVDGGAVTLADLRPNDGWDVTERDEEDGEVEIELRQGNVVWELDAEIDDGRLVVEIDFEVEGAFG